MRSILVKTLYKLTALTQAAIHSLEKKEETGMHNISDNDKHDDSFYSQYAENMRRQARRGVQNGFEEIISQTPVSSGQHILDIGIGVGAASRYFANHGLKVTATGTYSGLYGDVAKLCRQKEIELIECKVEKLSFTDNSFDAVWLSHVLEHVMNPGIALQEIHRVLVPSGWLMITVPRYKPNIVGGHVMTGWNTGQLMYVLLINGFEVKTGHFAAIQNNICAFVKKSKKKIPLLHGDIGDIEALTNHWPIEMKQGVNGEIDFVNWPVDRTKCN